MATVPVHSYRLRIFKLAKYCAWAYAPKRGVKKFHNRFSCNRDKYLHEVLCLVVLNVNLCRKNLKFVANFTSASSLDYLRMQQ